MNERTSKKARVIDLLWILAFLIVARISCPALSNLPFFSMAFTFVYGCAFLVLFLIYYPKFTRQEFTILGMIALFTLWVVGKSLYLGNGLFSRDAFNAYVIVFLTVIFLWSKRQPENRQLALFSLIMVAMVFNYIYSIWVLHQDPGASRTAAATSVLEKSPYDVLSAVGGFDAVYGGVSLVTIFLFMLHSQKEWNLRKWIILAIMVLAVVFIYMAAYATALLLLICTIALIFGSRNKVLAGVLVVAFLLILLFHDPLGQWLMDASSAFSDSEIMQTRTLEFGKMLKTFEAAGTYAGDDGRAARMQWSLNAFLADPLFGGYGKQGVKVGGHSELLDMLGKYGLLGFGLLAAYLGVLYRELKNKLQDPEMKKCCTIMFLIWIITAILNPALYSLQMIPIILVLPLCPTYMTARKLQ